MNAPPSSLLEAITKEVHATVGTLPPGARGALVGVATTNGVNLAVVSKVGEHVTIEGWIGKSWSAPIAGGGSVKVSW